MGFLGPECESEKVELAAGKIQQDHLPAVPIDPGGDEEDGLQHDAGDVLQIFEAAELVFGKSFV